ncbi:MAG: molybdopterin cofactor-binding domain-containing protein [Burkholderiaceae bacterium]
MTVMEARAHLEEHALDVRVNGLAVRCVSHPSVPLADVLREELGLTGTKIGCSAGDCGACTVLLDGQQVCSCITALGSCAGRSITTVEGLADQGELNALQKAFVELGAAQCGICTPGMLMAASDLLARCPHPTEEEVSDALGGVLCRCTGYRKIIEAVLVASGQKAQVELQAQPVGVPVESRPAAGHAVGARLPRLDAQAKVTGRERFGADVIPSDCLWMRVIRSPYPHARFELGDFRPLLRNHPGLADIITAADVPYNRFAIFDTPKDQPVFAEGEVRMRGEAVLALVGDKSALERIALDELPITWDIKPALEDPGAALAGQLPCVHAAFADNILCRGRVVKGDIEKALENSAFVARASYETGYVEHAYIEPEAGYAEIVTGKDGEGRSVDRLRIFASTQTPYMDRDEIARVMGWAAERVHIVPSAVGGGFGGKLDLAIQPLLAVAAWKLRRTVRIVYTREESMLSTTKRHPARIQAAYGCDAQGLLTGLDFQADFNTGAYASWGSTVANRVPVHATGPYRVGSVRALTRAVYTHNAIAGAFRGFGVPQAHIATEALLEELALKVGLDRLEFRLQNAILAGDPTATGQVLHSSVGMHSCLISLRAPWRAALAEVALWNAQAQMEGSPRRRGTGVASMWYGIGNTVMANPSSMQGALRSNGRLFLYNGAQEIGQGTSTILPQIFADAVGLPVALVDQVMGDTDATLDAGKSSASRQTFVSGNAARLAGEDLRAQLLERLQAPPSATLAVQTEGKDVVLVAEENDAHWRLWLGVTDAPAVHDIALGRGHFNPPTVPLDANGQGIPYATYGFAAQMATVEVDMELGTVKVLAIHAAHDVGRAVNPTQVEGQIHGGIAQGLGMALMEEYRSGVTDNLHDYLIPTVGDIPPITTYLIEDREPLGPYGAKGVGEPALVATAPAILNAVHDATGVWVRQIPATPARLLAAIKEAHRD